MVGILATAVATVQIILILNHHKSKQQNIQILNGFWIKMFLILSFFIYT